jgi:hypothetical protein
MISCCNNFALKIFIRIELKSHTAKVPCHQGQTQTTARTCASGRPQTMYVSSVHFPLAPQSQHIMHEPIYNSTIHPSIIFLLAANIMMLVLLWALC